MYITKNFTTAINPINVLLNLISSNSINGFFKNLTYKIKESKKISKVPTPSISHPKRHKELSLSSLPGIGRHTPKALARYGITTIKQFAQFEEQEVLALLGKSGLKLLSTAKTLAF